MIQRDDITIHDGTTADDFYRDQRTFIGNLLLGAGYTVTSQGYQAIGQEWIDAELRSQIMRRIYGDLVAALPVIEMALFQAGYSDEYPSAAKEALDTLRAHVAAVTGRESEGVGR